MKLYIPSIGDVIILMKDWKFVLYNEYRNDSLYNLVSDIPVNDLSRIFRKAENIEAVLVKGTVLSIDRIYIRKGNKQFDSVSFVVKQSPTFKKQKIRFWAKLNDVNNIEFELYKP